MHVSLDAIERLLEIASGLDPEVRASFLADACDDPALRAEVLSLLDADADAEGFFHDLAHETLPDGLLPPPPDDPLRLTGQTLGPYRVEHLLGRGGMGVVYRARDERLARDVALKLVLPGTLGDEAATERLLHEARIASQLDHAHIGTIYDVGQTPSGMAYVAMAYYAGETLRTRIGRSRLPLALALDIARQVALGLAHAHAQGVTHRDVKPGNVLLTHDGRAKVVDFGIAVPSGAASGRATLAYASPEQLDGRGVDHRCDVWGLGVLLYEMLARQSPFRRPDPESTRYAVLHAEPEPLASRCSQCTPALVRLVRGALQKDPHRRHPTMHALIDELDAVASHVDQPGSASPRPPGRALTSIVVLPFENVTGRDEDAYFCDGLADELVAGLTPITGLRVASRHAARAVALNGPAAAEGIDTILHGRLRRDGDRVRLHVELEDVGEQFVRWSRRYDYPVDALMNVQADLVPAILGQLRVELLADEWSAVVRRTTASDSAYRRYLRGRHLAAQRTPQSLAAATRDFRAAIEADPHYARAHVGLADCFVVQGFYGFLPVAALRARARVAAEQALALDPTLSEAHLCLGSICSMFERDIAAAEVHFRRALALSPNAPTAHRIYGGWGLLPSGRVDDAIRALRHAVQLDPLSPLMQGILAYNLWWSRRPHAALAEAEAGLLLDPHFWLARSARGLALELLGRHDEAVDMLEQVADDTRGLPLAVASYAHALASAGKEAQARALLEALALRARDAYVSPLDLALVHTGLGEHDRALARLREAVDVFAPWTLFVGIDPRFDVLHTLPAFRDLLDGAGIFRPATPGMLTDSSGQS